MVDLSEVLSLGEEDPKFLRGRKRCRRGKCGTSRPCAERRTRRRIRGGARNHRVRASEPEHSPACPPPCSAARFASRNPNRFPRSSPQKRSPSGTFRGAFVEHRRSRYGGMPAAGRRTDSASAHAGKSTAPGNRMPDSRLLQSLPPGRQPPGSRNTPSPRSPNPLRPSLPNPPSPNPNLRLRCSGTKTRPPCAIATSSVSSGRSMIRRLPHPLQLRRRNRKPRRNRLLSRLHPSRSRRLPNPNRLFLPKNRNRCKPGPKPKSCCSTL